MTIQLFGTTIKQTAQNTYDLKGVFTAAGSKPADRPNYWLTSKQAKDYIKLLTVRYNANAGIPAFEQNQRVISVTQGSGVNGGGTFVCRELVYAYAMWVSVEFLDAVIQAFDALATNQLDQAVAIAQSTLESGFAKREPNNANALSVILGLTVYQSQFYYAHLMAKGLLTRKRFKDGQSHYRPVDENAEWFAGMNRHTVLFNDKILPFFEDFEPDMG